MILSALCGYYRRLEEDPHIQTPTFGYAMTNIIGSLTIDENGSILNALSLCEKKVIVKSIRKGDKSQRKEVKVESALLVLTPIQPERTVNTVPAFLCDNSSYILGIDKTGRGHERYKQSGQYHRNVLQYCDDIGAKAVLRFFEKHEPGITIHDGIDVSFLPQVGNIIFRLKNDTVYLHERQAIKEAWQQYLDGQSQKASIAQCLVTGVVGPVERLHRKIHGLGQEMPKIVCFDMESSESYHKKQGDNATVSEDAAFQYFTALSFLLRDAHHKITLGSDKVAFWAERSAKREEDTIEFLGCSFNNVDNESEFERDETTSNEVEAILSSLRQGKRPMELGLDESVRFFLLGMSNNKSRLVIRFFYANTFADLVQRFVTHLQDIEICLSPRDRSVVTPLSILRETALDRRIDKIPERLESSLMRSILWGSPYSFSLYASMLVRIRAEAGSAVEGENSMSKSKKVINRVRVGMLKGYLNRIKRQNHQRESMQVALNSSEENTSYLLGRMLAIMEKAQQDALHEVNSSIIDRFLNAALETPQKVFPTLLKLFENHIAKIGRFYLKQQMEKVMEKFDSRPFPITLDAEQQGVFLIGYYHQRQALWTKRTDTEEKGDESNGRDA